MGSGDGRAPYWLSRTAIPVPPHLTPLPPLLSLVGEERGRMVGVFHTGCRAPQFRPPSRPPPAGAMHYPYLAYCLARVPERVGGVMTGVIPSRELGTRASGAHGAGTSAGGRSQAQAPTPGGIHKRPGQMNEPNVYPIRKPWLTRLPSPLPPPALGITHTWCQPRVYQRV